MEQEAPKPKGPNDGLVEALTEIADRSKAGTLTIFDILGIMHKHYGHNIKSVTMRGTQRVALKE